MSGRGAMAQTPTNIFEALRESHERQRAMAAQVLATSGDTPERQALFAQWREELTAHEVAEERHFYIPLMELDGGVDLSRHAIAEHHAIDELIEEIEAADPATSSWLAAAKRLAHKVEHHLEEEETRFFQMAGKLLSEAQKHQFADAYQQEYEAAKATA